MSAEYELLGATLDPGLVVLLSLAGIVTAVPAGLGLAVFVRRRSRSYLFVALALLALFARSLVAAAAMLGYVPDGAHHLLEHGLDTAMAALVIGAVYYSRSIEAAQPAPGK